MAGPSPHKVVTTVASDESIPGRGERARLLAPAAFAVGLLAAFVVLLRIGPRVGFFYDEWDYLSARTAWDVGDMLRPHNEHWSTLPILLYRAWYRLFGLGSYLPYRALAVVAHLATAAAMRIVLRRMDLGPWLASAVVLPWILFGSGWEDIVWGFQVAFGGALALGLAQLLLADHPGPRRGRDAAGVMAGLGSLMFAGIALPVTAAVGLSLLLRRGWRVAALHVAPLAVAYLLWVLTHGDLGGTRPGVSGETLSFMWTTLSTTVSSFGWWPGVGALLGAAVVALLALELRHGDPQARRERLAIPAAFTVGAVLFLCLLASGRASFGAELADSPRYLHVAALLLLPAVGAAARTAAERVRAARPPQARALSVLGLAVLWAGLPGNLSELTERSPERLAYGGQLQRVEAVAAAVTDRPDLPDEGQPLPLAIHVTLGWIREAAAEGVLEPTPAEGRREQASIAQALELLQIDRAADPATCRALDGPATIEMAAGQTIAFQGLLVSAEVTGPAGRHIKVFDLDEMGHTLYATAPIEVVLRPLHAGLRVCDQPPEG